MSLENNFDNMQEEIYNFYSQAGGGNMTVFAGARRPGMMGGGFFSTLSRFALPFYGILVDEYCESQLEQPEMLWENSHEVWEMLFYRTPPARRQILLLVPPPQHP